MKDDQDLKPKRGGRPRLPDDQKAIGTTISIDPKSRALISDWAESNGLSFSAAIRELAWRGLEAERVEGRR